jgi:hypothetical protein
MSDCSSQSCCCTHKSCGCQSKECSCCYHKSQCECQTSSNCGSCGCGCQGMKEKCGCRHCCCNHTQKFLELADHAWMELLKEKIKEHIQSHAKNIDELARLIAEANHERWQKKMEDKQCGCGYEEKLKNFFKQACQTGQKTGYQQ